MATQLKDPVLWIVPMASKFFVSLFCPPLISIGAGSFVQVSLPLQGTYKVLATIQPITPMPQSTLLLFRQYPKISSSFKNHFHPLSLLFPTTSGSCSFLPISCTLKSFGCESSAELLQLPGPPPFVKPLWSTNNLQDLYHCYLTP